MRKISLKKKSWIASNRSLRRTWPSLLSNLWMCACTPLYDIVEIDMTERAQLLYKDRVGVSLME